MQHHDRALIAPEHRSKLAHTITAFEHVERLRCRHANLNLPSELSTKVPAAPDWIYEIKHWAYRLIVHRRRRRADHDNQQLVRAHD